MAVAALFPLSPPVPARQLANPLPDNASSPPGHYLHHQRSIQAVNLSNPLGLLRFGPVRDIPRLRKMQPQMKSKHAVPLVRIEVSENRVR